MKKQSLGLILLGFLLAVIILITSFAPKNEAVSVFGLYDTSDQSLSTAVYEILNSKCNMPPKTESIYGLSEKNMTKKATKIYEMVFVEKRMPKGNDIKLTEEEYMLLKKWLKTQQLF